MSATGRLIVGGALAGLAGWYLWRQQQAGRDYYGGAGAAVGGWLDQAETAVSDITGAFMKVSNMRQVTAQDVANKNVQAFLRVIRAGEGTADADGYRRIFGGQLFTDYADHPRITVKKSGYTSSAAGAYQFIISSWDETKRMMGLTDFSPSSQDKAAVGRIAARGALEDVKAGRFEAAVKKVAREWASLPGSPYGQPVISMDRARAVYMVWGGHETLPGEGFA